MRRNALKHVMPEEDKPEKQAVWQVRRSLLPRFSWEREKYAAPARWPHSMLRSFVTTPTVSFVRWAPKPPSPRGLYFKP